MSKIKFINKSNNTVYLAIVDKNIPYIGDDPQEIDLDDIKKSQGFKKMVMMGKFEIVECGDSLFERNLLKMQNTLNNKKNTEEEIGEFSGDIEVKIRGSFYEAGGYAKVNRNLAFGLSACKIKVQTEAISKMIYGLNEQEANFLSMLKKPVSREAIVIDSMIPSMTEIGFGKYRILYTTIEASTMPEQFVEIMNMYNEIWVTSDFCKEVISKYNIKPDIYVIPPSININLYNEKCKAYEFNPKLKNFIFISVFGWGYRKGYDVLLKAYLQEFSGDEDVTLLLRTGLSYNTGRENPVKTTVEEYIKKYGGNNPAHIARCTRSFTDSEMPSIYKACDAYVLFTRGEGFCTLPNAIIKTKNDNIPIKNIKVGDDVFSHTGRARKVSHVFSRYYDGPMIKIKSYGRNNQYLHLTPNHMVRAIRTSELSSATRNKLLNNCIYDCIDDKIIHTHKNVSHYKNQYIKYNLEWVPVSDLKKGDVLFYPKIIYDDKLDKINLSSIDSIVKRFYIENNVIYKKISNQYNINIPSKKIMFDNDSVTITDDLMELFGYYVSEGCCGLNGDILFSFNSKEKIYMNRVCYLMKKCFNIKKNKSQYFDCKCCVTLKFFNSVIAELFRFLFGHGARNKNLPKWFFNLDDKLIYYFLSSLFKGDGCIGKQRFKDSGKSSDKISFSTASINLANCIFDLLQRLGIASSIKRRFIDKKEYFSVNISNIKDHNIFVGKINYGEEMFTKRSYHQFINRKDFQLIKIKDITQYHYNGEVYNIGVEEENSYICENVAVHNCLPYAESSLCGLPVIATNHSGQTMFLNKDNSYLIDIDELSEMQAGMMDVHYWDNQKFPSLTSEKVIQDARKSMREVYENYPKAKAKNKKLSKFLSENYNMGSISLLAGKRLVEIWRKLS